MPVNIATITIITTTTSPLPPSTIISPPLSSIIPHHHYFIDYYLPTSDVEAPHVLAVQGKGVYSEELVALRGLGTSFTHNYMHYLNATDVAGSTKCDGRGGGGGGGDIGGGGGGGGGDDGGGCGGSGDGGGDRSCDVTEANHAHTDTKEDNATDNPKSSSPRTPPPSAPSSQDPTSSLSWFAASSFIRALHRNTTGTRASLLVTLRLPAAAHLYIIPFPLYKVVATTDSGYNHHRILTTNLPISNLI